MIVRKENLGLVGERRRGGHEKKLSGYGACVAENRGRRVHKFKIVE
jgi:hypothetical protein